MHIFFKVRQSSSKFTSFAFKLFKAILFLVKDFSLEFYRILCEKKVVGLSEFDHRILIIKPQVGHSDPIFPSFRCNAY